MALKALMIRKKLDEKNKALEDLRSKDAEFEKREADLETAIDEASTDEERSAVEEEIEKFEGEKTAHDDHKDPPKIKVRGAALLKLFDAASALVGGHIEFCVFVEVREDPHLRFFHFLRSSFLP